MNKNKKTYGLSITKCLWYILWISIGIYIIWIGLDLKEGYRNTNTSYNIDLPINTRTSCDNFCGPTATCSITGEQCSSDPDCYGCIPPNKRKPRRRAEVNAYNDAGKLTSEMNPTYSVLTTDIGTRAYKIKSMNDPTPRYNRGINMWIKAFNEELLYYGKRYNPQFGVNESLLKYQSRPTLSGEFINTGPLPSND